MYHNTIILRRSQKSKIFFKKMLKGKEIIKTVVFLRNAGKVYILQVRSQKIETTTTKPSNKTSKSTGLSTHWHHFDVDSIHMFCVNNFFVLFCAC